MTVWLRASLPRMRYDRLMALGWKYLIEIAILWVLVSAASWSASSRAGTRGSSRRCRPSIALVAFGDAVRRDTQTGRARGGVPLMGRLSGFNVTLRQMFKPALPTQYPKVKRRQARAPARPPRSQSLRRRHGEVHRLRAVRRCVPGALHLRARRRQPGRRSGLAGGALRLRLRDQLPPLHPLRPVRGGVPDRGHHRDQALRVLVHQPRRRDLHEAGARRRRERPRPADAVGAVERRRGRPHQRAGCALRHRAGRPRTRAGSAGRASSASACGRPSRVRPTSCRHTPSWRPISTSRARATDAGVDLLHLRGGGARGCARCRARATTPCTRRCSCCSRS